MILSRPTSNRSYHRLRGNSCSKGKLFGINTGCIDVLHRYHLPCICCCNWNDGVDLLCGCFNCCFHTCDSGYTHGKPFYQCLFCLGVTEIIQYRRGLPCSPLMRWKCFWFRTMAPSITCDASLDVNKS